MKPLAITNKQFVTWLIVTAGAFTLFMFGDDSVASMAMGILAFTQFVIMTPAERSRPLARQDLLLFTIGSLALIGICFAIGHWIPDNYGKAVTQCMRHPAFVIPFWALSVWLVYRRWRLSATDGHNVV